MGRRPTPCHLLKKVDENFCYRPNGFLVFRYTNEFTKMTFDLFFESFCGLLLRRPTSRKCHKPKRERALFVGFVCFALTKNRCGGFSSQNDVKFAHTNSAKVSVKPVTIWGLRSKFAPLGQNQIVNRGRLRPRKGIAGLGRAQRSHSPERNISPSFTSKGTRQ